MTRILWIFSGVMVWALHFSVLYGFTAIACARGLSAAVPWVGGLATVVALCAVLFICSANMRRRGEFNSWLAIAVAALACLAILFEAVPLFTVAICT